EIVDVVTTFSYHVVQYLGTLVSIIEIVSTRIAQSTESFDGVGDPTLLKKDVAKNTIVTKSACSYALTTLTLKEKPIDLVKHFSELSDSDRVSPVVGTLCKFSSLHFRGCVNEHFDLTSVVSVTDVEILSAFRNMVRIFWATEGSEIVRKCIDPFWADMMNCVFEEIIIVEIAHPGAIAATSAGNVTGHLVEKSSLDRLPELPFATAQVNPEENVTLFKTYASNRCIDAILQFSADADVTEVDVKSSKDFAQPMVRAPVRVITDWLSVFCQARGAAHCAARLEKVLLQANVSEVDSDTAFKTAAGLQLCFQELVVELEKTASSSAVKGAEAMALASPVSVGLLREWAGRVALFGGARAAQLAKVFSELLRGQGDVVSSTVSTNNNLFHFASLMGTRAGLPRIAPRLQDRDLTARAVAVARATLQKSNIILATVGVESASAAKQCVSQRRGGPKHGASKGVVGQAPKASGSKRAQDGEAGGPAKKAPGGSADAGGEEGGRWRRRREAQRRLGAAPAPGAGGMPVFGH
ncbi:unnamed protein product, partial [Prorocentrum cordatum]